MSVCTARAKREGGAGVPTEAFATAQDTGQQDVPRSIAERRELGCCLLNGLMQAWSKEQRRQGDCARALFNRLTVSMLGTTRKPYLRGKAAETRSAVPFAGPSTSSHFGFSDRLCNLPGATRAARGICVA